MIENYSFGFQFSRNTLSNIDAVEYVNAEGEIALRLKHKVFAPNLAFTFESFVVDQVESKVNE